MNGGNIVPLPQRKNEGNKELHNSLIYMTYAHYALTCKTKPSATLQSTWTQAYNQNN